jgi:hypothetical protein
MHYWVLVTTGVTLLKEFVIMHYWVLVTTGVTVLKEFVSAACKHVCKIILYIIFKQIHCS